jgi:AcrR family transcriptional regulator
MRLPDDNKRRQIIITAADMFASSPYHKVRLDDVAAAAGVGKGTLYVYFQSKEDLYFTIIYEGLALLLSRLKTQLALDHSGAAHRLRTIVDELVEFAFNHPQFFELLKTVGVPLGNPQWDQARNEMFDMIEQIIRGGVESGELKDNDPHLTARFVPGMVRSAMLFGPKDLDPALLKQQIQALLEQGLGCSARAGAAV